MSQMKNCEIVICNEKTVGYIKQWTNLLAMFLSEVSYLTEAYILDYFVDYHWNKIPLSWQSILQNFSTEDLRIFIDLKENPRYKKPWPLSLLSFRACSFVLAVQRCPVKSTKPIESFLQETFFSSCPNNNANKSETRIWSDPEYEFFNESGQHKNIPEFCRRHVKRKKQHEIFRLAQLTDIVLKSFNLQHVIDVGSGQGHLSRLLAFCYNYNVATIEAEECHIVGATNFDKQAHSSLMREKSRMACVEKETTVTSNEELKKVKIESSLPYHSESSMTVTTSKECIEKVLKNAGFADCDAQHKLKCALLGLHTCGDLAVTVLQSFIQCSQPQVLISVACCYMKLNSKKDERSYPLSSFVNSLPNSDLSYEARELSCHALEMYCKKLEANSPSLKIHCYRAVLEKCILHHYPNMKHIGLRGVKRAELMPFHEYAEKALSKIDICISKEYLSSDNIQTHVEDWKKVLIFYTLRLIIAPVVESLLLIDKMLYLYENGHSSCLVPLFEPSISPRNHVLISAKSLNM